MAARSSSKLKLAGIATAVKQLLRDIIVRLLSLVTIVEIKMAVVDFDRFNFVLSFAFYYYSL